MSEETIRQLMQLPLNSKTYRLWRCLHDGGIDEFKSNLLERKIQIDFEVLYLCEFHQLPLDLRFIIEFMEVRSVASFVFRSWPGELSIPNGISHDEESRLKKVHFGKGRDESESWDNFEISIAQFKDN